MILGGGTAGWMAANLMFRRWADAEIAVLESPEVGIIGVGEGSTPQLKSFFAGLGVEEADWMPKCNATYKNGISFAGWSERKGFARYFHPFPSPIDAHTAPAFSFHSHYRRQGFDLDADPNRYFLSARLAQQRLAPKPARNFPFDIAYGYHFDAHLVGAVLRDHAKSGGVRHHEGKATRVARTEAGDVASISTEDGRAFEADLFVDASGFRGMIVQEALGAAFRPFASNLFNDSAVVLPTPADPAGLNAETRATALRNGWAWDIPLTNRTGNGYVYSSRYCSADDAERELRAHLGLLESSVAARHLKMKVGRVEKHWTRNCLAVGLSQGFIEPLEATALHLVQATVESFMAMLEAGRFTNEKEGAFNTMINARFEGVRDYIVCHYRASLRSDTAYWRDNSAIDDLSDSLRSVLACWFAGGDMKEEIAAQDISKYYALTSWQCLLGGYGNYPQALKPPPAELRRFDPVIIDDFIARAALNFPDHRTAVGELSGSNTP